VAVDCVRRRSKWMLCNFFGKVVVEPTAVEHFTGGPPWRCQAAPTASYTFP
jgi:hypothetical protein